MTYIIGDHDRHLNAGLIDRNYEVNPVGCYGAGVPWDMGIQLIPREEWPERIRQKTMDRTRLSDIRNRGDSGSPIKSYDQNGQGYCWSYSTTACLTLLRAAAGMPYERLSAHSVAWTIKGGRDQGGWAALSLDFISTRGVMPESLWPAQSMDGRRHGTTENWTKAKGYRVTEGWMEIQKQPYDRDVSPDQVATCLLCNVPVASDYMWWGHSVCAMDLVDHRPSLPATDLKRYGVLIWNSWADRWGENGAGLLTDSKAFPDGAVVPRVAFGS
jgi:hypothetical protein